MINFELPYDKECLEEQIIATHLKEIISETVAYKILNGVPVKQDGKQLINKKSIKSFMQYLCEKMYKEAQEQKVRGYHAVAKDGTVILEQAIQYFDDDKIIGDLYDENGTLYKKAPDIPKNAVKSVQTVVTKKQEPPKPQQFTLFDMLTEEKKEEKPVVEETPPQEEEPAPDIQAPNEEECLFDEEDVDRETGEILHFKTPKPKRGSPLYQKYIQVQNQYPQAVIAYRLGDFFEVFGDNAVNVANRMELTLTGRDCGLPERVPMVGFPYHISDTYFKKIAQFSPLVVVDNNEVTPYVLEEKTAIETPVTEENEHTMYENTDVIDDFEEERALQKFFDKDALCALYELFDYNLDMQ